MKQLQYGFFSEYTYGIFCCVGDGYYKWRAWETNGANTNTKFLLFQQCNGYYIKTHGLISTKLGQDVEQTLFSLCAK